MVSTDGGSNWINQTYDLSDKATELEEWEFHSNGVHDLFVLNVRYQSSDGPDIDISGMSEVTRIRCSRTHGPVSA